MKTKVKIFILGLVLGGTLAFPLGINYGRDLPLLSNPLADHGMRARMTSTVKQKTGELVDNTKEKIHDATRPVRED